MIIRVSRDSESAYIRVVQHESQKIKERYGRRLPVAKDPRYSDANVYMRYVVEERERMYAKLLNGQFNRREGIRVLEIGAGSGSNIRFFKEYGIRPENIVANELMDERIAMLRTNHPDIAVVEGDATLMRPEQFGTFDVVFQSTVFTSVLDSGFRRKLADTMMSLLSENGMLLWYDFVYDNPSNADVKGVRTREMKELFSLPDWEVHRVTLAPPVGRRIGRLYPVFNAFPFLRTHIVAAGTRGQK